MYLLGHVGFTILWAFIVQRNFNIKPMKHKLVIGFGAMFPDLIDKPIGSILFGKGRWFGHSIIFQAMILLISLVVIRQYQLERKHEQPLRMYTLLIFLGSICHMMLDQPGLGRDVIFWPLYGSIPRGNREDFLVSAFTSRVLITEMVGLFFLLSIGAYEKWSKKEWNVLIKIVIVYAFLVSTLYILLV